MKRTMRKCKSPERSLGLHIIISQAVLVRKPNREQHAIPAGWRVPHPPQFLLATHLDPQLKALSDAISLPTRRTPCGP